MVWIVDPKRVGMFRQDGAFQSCDDLHFAVLRKVRSGPTRLRRWRRCSPWSSCIWPDKEASHTRRNSRECRLAAVVFPVRPATMTSATALAKPPVTMILRGDHQRNRCSESETASRSKGLSAGTCSTAALDPLGCEIIGCLQGSLCHHSGADHADVTTARRRCAWPISK